MSAKPRHDAEAITRAIAAARWPSGDRVVEASDEAIRQYVTTRVLQALGEHTTPKPTGPKETSRA